MLEEQKNMWQFAENTIKHKLFKIILYEENKYKKLYLYKNILY